MSRVLHQLALLLGLAWAPLQAQEPQSEELFDGRTLAGWSGEEGFWSVQDGVLTGESTPAHLAARTTYLVWTKSKVRDFELTLEFKLVGGNSGVQFRSRGDGPFDVAGYQADLEDGPNWSGCLYEQDGRGVVATRGQRVEFDAQGQRTLTDFGDPAEILAHVRPREWNTYRIRAVGPRIDLEINGVRTTTLIDRDPARAASEGCLALQLHQGMPMKAQFRNLQLMRLPADAPPPADPAARPAAQGPQWIWSTLPAKEKEEAWLGTRFELRAPAKLVRISGCADNSFSAELDGELVLAGEDWEHPVKAQLAHPLAAGAHEFVAHATNQGGPAGAWFELDCELEDGSTLHVPSDASWRAGSTQAQEGWQAASVIGPRGISPWGNLPAPVEASATGSLAAESIHVPAGFVVERLYSVPKSAQGSWISLAFDPEGRIYSSDQYGGLYRTSFTPDRSAVERVERVPIALGEAHGLLWAFDALYAVVTNGGTYSSGLYRARDTNGDDVLDKVELLSKFEERGGEHGPHAVVLGPDKRSLYVLAGNHTSLPSPLARSCIPKLWAEDDLLPRCEDPNGHAVGIKAPGGWLARTDPDGKSWELVAGGMRNAYDFDFDEEGEAFTYDSDMEWDVGLPWYRPTRVLHLVSGSEFGWRSGSGVFPAWVPDSLPAAVNVGLGSPTAVAFGYHSNFPAPWRERFFAGDWAYGRILAIELDPQGSSWSGSWQVFASGRPLPVTDLLFGPDGALYFAVGGRRTSSGLYRVRWSGAPSSERPAPAAGRAERDARRALENGHASPRELLPALESHDPFLRGAARAALEQLPVEDWVGLLAEPRKPRAAVELVLALARAEAGSSGKRVFTALDTLPFERWNAEDRRDALRVWQVALARAGKPAEAIARRVRARCLPLLSSSDYESQRVLLDLLVFLEEPAVVAFAIDAATKESDGARAMAYAWPLRAARAGWTPALRSRFFQWLNRSQTLWAGGASFMGYFRHLRSEVLAGMDEAARSALGVLAEEPQPPKVEGEPVSIVNRWNESALTPLLPELRQGRSFENGKRAFTRARCSECHRIADEGGNRGPDLTGAGARFSERDLLEAVLRPSASITDQYAQTQVVTRDDRLYVGRVEGETATTLVLHVSTPVDESVTIDKEEISERAPSRLSPMPEGLLDVLDEGALLDLLAYVLAGAQPASPAFH